MKMKYLLAALVIILNSETQAQRTAWLIPDFTTIQYSSSIGYLSAGMGYDVIKSMGRFSAHYGIVPDFHGASLSVVSAKLFFKPTTLTIWNRVRMNPVDVGLTGSYHFGGKLQKQLPDGVYPRGYYWWRPALRAHLGMESSVTYEFPKGHKWKSITGYIEFNTNEHYFLKFIQHVNTVRLWDVVTIGTGARLYF